MELKLMPFKFRPNPLVPGPNIDRIVPKYKKAITDYVKTLVQGLGEFERSGYVADKSGLILKGAFTSSYAEYHSDFGVDPISLVKGSAANAKDGKLPVVLDVGCGLAVAARTMAERLQGRADVFGMDIHKFEQMNASPHLPPIEVITGIMESFPFTGRPFLSMIMFHNSLSYSLLPYVTLDQAMEFLEPSGKALINLSLEDKDQRQFAFFGAIAATLVELSGKSFSDYPKIKVTRKVMSSTGMSFGFTIEKPENKMKRDFFADLAEKRKYPNFMPWRFAANK